jgi:hypothetical protein
MTDIAILFIKRIQCLRRPTHRGYTPIPATEINILSVSARSPDCRIAQGRMLRIVAAAIGPLFWRGGMRLGRKEDRR